MTSLKAKIAGLSTLAVAAGTALVMAGSAAAVTTPSSNITNDPNASNGTIAFYDVSGAQVTSGTDLTSIFKYAVTSSAGRTGATKATAYFAFPDSTKPDSKLWYKSQTTPSSNFPNAGAPAPVNGFTTPVATAGSGDANLQSLLSTTTLDTTSGYAGIVQVRVYDSGPGVPFQQAPFWASDIFFNESAGTWQQVYPKVVTSTTTTLVANPDPSTVGQNVTLTATVTPSAAGSVDFKYGTTDLGSAAVASGSAHISTNGLPQGSDNLSAIFTPTDATTFGPSTGTFTATVNPAATPTSTSTPSVSGGYTTTGSDATLTATVTPSAAAGTVAFYDNGSTTAIPGTVTSPSAGTYTLDVAAGFSSGGHSIIAKFTPTTVTQYQASQSYQAATFLTQAPVVGACAQSGSSCTDTQNIQATIPTGTLVISTPYTASSPLDLGTLALNSGGTQFTGSASFNNISVTDLRSGGAGWTVSALSSNLTDGGSHANSVINSQNVGLTTIQATPGAGFTGTVTPTDNAAANPAVGPTATGSQGLGGTTPHTVAVADNGRGTVTMKGTLTLNAPTSTEAGLFTGTITFTVG